MRAFTTSRARARPPHLVSMSDKGASASPPAALAAPTDGTLIVPGEAPAAKPRKRIKLLNRTPSPVILDDYGAIEPARCTVGGPGIAGGIVGVPTQVTVTARDANGIGIREGGERFIMTMQHTSTGSIVREYESTDRGDGSYMFQGVRADLKGMHKVRYSSLPLQLPIHSVIAYSLQQRPVAGSAACFSAVPEAGVKLQQLTALCAFSCRWR